MRTNNQEKSPVKFRSYWIGVCKNEKLERKWGEKIKKFLNKLELDFDSEGSTDICENINVDISKKKRRKELEKILYESQLYYTSETFYE